MASAPDCWPGGARAQRLLRYWPQKGGASLRFERRGDPWLSETVVIDDPRADDFRDGEAGALA